MKIQILLGLIVAFVASTDGALRCYTCENKDSIQSCITGGEVKQCQSNENACETHVRRDGDKELIFKTCKQALACVNNEIQNPRAAATPVQCNDQGQTSVCRCCCYNNLCARDTTDCTELGSTPSDSPPTTTPKPETFCEDPEEWSQGEVECGDSLSNGLFALRHKCKLNCTGETILVDGAKDIITCRINPSNPSSERGVWLPSYPDCRDDPALRCQEPPVWEDRPEGVVCGDEEADGGGYEVGHVCAYICPENSKLVGSDTSVCSRFIDGESSQEVFRFVPPHPCCEPNCDPNAPADILFVLDHSTSITAARWPMITRFVNNVIEEFDLDFVQFGVVVYGRGVLTNLNIPFDYTKSKDELQQRVTALPYGGQQSGTHTVAALNYARNSAFTSSFGDRPNVPDYVIFVTDGVSNDKVNIGGGETTLNLAADLLHGVTDATYAVGVGNFVQAELEIIASRDDFIATTNDFGKLNELLEQVTTVTCVPQCS